MRRWTRSAAGAVGLALALVCLGGGQPMADWRHDLKVLRIGFLAAESPATAMARLEPFRAYLEARLSFPVELVPATTWGALIDAEVSARVSYAMHSATSFAATKVTCDCIVPLAVPTAADGSRGFYSVLVARADSPIDSLAAAKGARLALTEKDSLAGRLIPLKAFAAEGLDPAVHFSAIIEAAGPEAAIAAVLAGAADVAVGWSSLAGDPATGFSFGVLTRMVVDGRLAADQVKIVWRSRLIPFGPHAVRKDMPDELKALLLQALEALAGEAPDILDAVDRSSFGGGGFVAAEPGDYAVVEELVAPAVTPPEPPSDRD